MTMTMLEGQVAGQALQIILDTRGTHTIVSTARIVLVAGQKSMKIGKGKLSLGLPLKELQSTAQDHSRDTTLRQLDQLSGKKSKFSFIIRLEEYVDLRSYKSPWSFRRRGRTLESYFENQRPGISNPEITKSEDESSTP